MSKWLKIKDFAKLVGVSRRTLQYYDEIGLLTPEKVDEHGHRYYGQQNFATAFIINSLKGVGMSLKDIKAYLFANEFSMSDFISEEKIRLTSEISELQRKVLLLENLEQYQESDLLADPRFISLFSQENENVRQMTKLVEEIPSKIDYNLVEANQFMSDLNYCRQHDLAVTEPLVIKCLTYWQKMLDGLGDHAAFMTGIAEEKYQKETNHYGMTGENYHYLQKILSSNKK